MLKKITLELTDMQKVSVDVEPPARLYSERFFEALENAMLEARDLVLEEFYKDEDIDLCIYAIWCTNVNGTTFRL